MGRHPIIPPLFDVTVQEGSSSGREMMNSGKMQRAFCRQLPKNGLRHNTLTIPPLVASHKLRKPLVPPLPVAFTMPALPVSHQVVPSLPIGGSSDSETSVKGRAEAGKEANRQQELHVRTNICPLPICGADSTDNSTPGAQKQAADSDSQGTDSQKTAGTPSSRLSKSTEELLDALEAELQTEEILDVIRVPDDKDQHTGQQRPTPSGSGIPYRVENHLSQAPAVKEPSVLIGPVPPPVPLYSQRLSSSEFFRPIGDVHPVFFSGPPYPPVQLSNAWPMQFQTYPIRPVQHPSWTDLVLGVCHANQIPVEVAYALIRAALTQPLVKNLDLVALSQLRGLSTELANLCIQQFVDLLPSVRDGNYSPFFQGIVQSVCHTEYTRQHARNDAPTWYNGYVSDWETEDESCKHDKQELDIDRGNGMARDPNTDQLHPRKQQGSQVNIAQESNADAPSDMPRRGFLKELGDSAGTAKSRAPSPVEQSDNTPTSVEGASSISSFTPEDFPRDTGTLPRLDTESSSVDENESSDDDQDLWELFLRRQPKHKSDGDGAGEEGSSTVVSYQGEMHDSEHLQTEGQEYAVGEEPGDDVFSAFMMAHAQLKSSPSFAAAKTNSSASTKTSESGAEDDLLWRGSKSDPSPDLLLHRSNSTSVSGQLGNSEDSTPSNLDSEHDVLHYLGFVDNSLYQIQQAEEDSTLPAMPESPIMSQIGDESNNDAGLGLEHNHRNLSEHQKNASILAQLLPDLDDWQSAAAFEYVSHSTSLGPSAADENLLPLEEILGF